MHSVVIFIQMPFLQLKKSYRIKKEKRELLLKKGHVLDFSVVLIEYIHILVSYRVGIL